MQREDWFHAFAGAACKPDAFEAIYGKPTVARSMPLTASGLSGSETSGVRICAPPIFWVQNENEPHSAGDEHHAKNVPNEEQRIAEKSGAVVEGHISRENRGNDNDRNQKSHRSPISAIRRRALV